MRCSSCEPLLDRYVEGTLRAREMLAVRSHLDACERCRVLLEELKAIDGLLATAQGAELPPNFAFAVMAEVRAMPVHTARQHPIWSFLALYLPAAWVACVAAMAFTGTAPATVLSVVWGALARAGEIAGVVAAGLSRSLAHTAPLAAFGFGMLALDSLAALAVGLLYFVVRPRLAARLASS